MPAARRPWGAAIHEHVVEGFDRVGAEHGAVCVHQFDDPPRREMVAVDILVPQA